MTTSTQVGITHLVEGQASAEVTINDAINKLDAVVHLAIKDRNLTAPPGSPTEGDRYIPAATATGAWASQENKIAVYLSGWVFITPKEGWIAHIDDEEQTIHYTGSAWVLWQGMSQETGITASTTQTQAGGYALTKDINFVATCANANDSVTLPPAEQGRHMLIYNSGATKVKYWPASGDQLDGLSVDAGTTINANRWAELWAVSDALWIVTT